ncbi:MAG: LPS export ABC transporter permease LptF, partial [Gammaproteobacteria bacterium]
MQIIDRYLIKEVTLTLLAVMPVLLLIFLSNRFVQYLAEAAAGKLPSDVLWALLAFRSISVLSLLLPLAFFLSVVLALGRFYKDSEMTVLAACGVSPLRIVQTVGVAGLVMALLVAALTFYIEPWANGQTNQIRKRAEATSETKIITPGRFKESRQGDHILYVEGLSPDLGKMHNIFIQSRHGDTVNILSSENGYQYLDKQTGDQYVVLENGNRYEWTPGGGNFKLIKYAKYTVRIEQKDIPVQHTLREVAGVNPLLQAMGQDARAELQWRLSLPFSMVVLAVLGALLARTTPRQGRFGKLFIAVLVYVIYVNLMTVARSWVENAVAPSLFGMWWVHGIALIVVTVLFMQQMGIRVPRPSFSALRAVLPPR